MVTRAGKATETMTHVTGCFEKVNRTTFQNKKVEFKKKKHNVINLNIDI